MAFLSSPGTEPRQVRLEALVFQKEMAGCVGIRSLAEMKKNCFF